MECKKCSSPANVLLRKKDSYCNNCFITNSNHKFRACIGKNKILSKNEKVLVCLSGGLSSTVLLDLVYNGLSMDSHKKLRIIPSFFYLIGIETDSFIKAEDVIKQCKKYEFDVHLSHISEYMKENLEMPTINSIPPVDSIAVNQFDSLLTSLPPTTSNDHMLKIQRNLFIKVAEKLECNFVFTAENTATLAINLLSNLALGRGSQIEHDVGFCDTRNEKIKIVKPMKEISQEELIYYSNLKQLNPIKNNQIKPNSIQSVIGTFVTDLQDTFPATISTVCKTADKIGNHNETDSGKKCVICESNLRTEKRKLSALEATKYSRSVSDKRPHKAEDSLNNIPNSEFVDEDVNVSLFPHIHRKLCYGCSRNYLETDKHKMPNHVQVLLHNL